MRRLAAICVVLAAGCSYTFDSNAPTLPYIGDAPDTNALPRLNTMPVDSEVFALGADGRVWLLFQHTDQSWEMQPMSGAAASDNVDPDETIQLVTWRALYITRSGSAGGVDGGVPDMAVGPDMATPRAGDMGPPPPPNIELVVRSVGEHPGQVFTVPDGPALLYSMGADDKFAYIVMNAALPGYLIQRRDNSFKRIVPWPKGIDPNNPFKNGLFFTDDGAGDTFYDRDADGRIVGHRTYDNEDIDLGIRPRLLAWADSQHLVTCGPDGIRYLPVDGQHAETVLDGDLCKGLLGVASGYVYYVVATVVRKAKLDGSEVPKIVFDFGQARVLSIAAPDDFLVYSTDPADRYVHGAGDGWLDGWKFMNRGLDVQFNDDRTALYWLENAAQGSGTGNLKTVKLSGPGVIPGGASTTLALNTRQYTQLGNGDGRILCDENHANNGIWNRVVLIDEARGHKQYVAVGADHPSPIPQSNDYIVDVVTGATGHDVVRVPLPAPVDGGVITPSP